MRRAKIALLCNSVALVTGVAIVPRESGLKQSRRLESSKPRNPRQIATEVESLKQLVPFRPFVISCFRDGLIILSPNP
jgi:hypothetical protein